MNSRSTLCRLLRNVLPSAALLVLALVAQTHAGTVCDPDRPWRQEMLLGGYADDVEAVAWSPDGSQFIGGGGPWDNNGKVWDAESGTVNYVLPHAYIVYGVAWSPDGGKVATASGDHTAKTWDPSTGELIFELAHDPPVLSVAWSPDAAQLATGALDGRVRIWSAESGELQATIAGTGRFAYSVGWSPDGNRLAFGSGTAVEIWTRCPEGVAR